MYPEKACKLKRSNFKKIHKKLEFSLSSEDENVALVKLVKIIPERGQNINDSCDEYKYTSDIDFPTDYKFGKIGEQFTS